MKKSHIAFMALLAMPLPALADTVTMGRMDATFDGAAITQTTLRVTSGDETMATAEIDQNHGLTNLSIYGGDLRQQLSLNVMFMGDTLDPGAQPIEASVAWFPKGMGDHWSSDDAPTPATFTFSRLEFAGDAGHATGTFTATLCAVTMSGPPAGAPDCRPITGSFDTSLARMAD
jgi:hypothetical protein